MIKNKIVKISFIFFLFISGLFAVDELLSNLRNRASENLLYEKLEKIQIINKYINQFIIHNGSVPTRTNLIDYCQTMNANEINDGWWPTSYDDTNGTQKIAFSVDVNNSTIIYSNIFTTYPTDSTKQLFIRNTNMIADSIVLDSRVNPPNSPMPILQVPFDIDTSEFQVKINKILANITPIPLIGRSLQCNFARSGYTWYEPDGAGGFIIRYCNSSSGYVWETIPNIEEKELENTTELIDNKLFYVGQDRYKEFNSTTSEKIIFTDQDKNYAKVFR